MAAPIKYYYRRRMVQVVGRVIQLVLARVTVTGRENLPRKGPLIVVGNHVGYAEPALMVTTMPWPIELVGAGDIPLRSKFLFLQNLYGYLPVNRGEIDRTALKAISEILEKGGSVGIFPEGGIWDRKIGDARMGVAYLSQQTQTPILPIGFGGVVGALDKAIRFKRPKVSVQIGKVLPAVPTSENYRERKALAQAASQQIMQAIYDLVPPDDEINQLGSRDEAFELTVAFADSAGKHIDPPANLAAIPNGDEVALLFHRPVLLSVVVDNLGRTVAEPLRHLDTERNAAAIRDALREALHVYTEEKPVFLGYRLGYQRADRIVKGLEQLQKLAGWAADAGLSMNIMPKVKITFTTGKVETYDYPTEAHQAG